MRTCLRGHAANGRAQAIAKGIRAGFCWRAGDISPSSPSVEVGRTRPSAIARRTKDDGSERAVSRITQAGRRSAVGGRRRSSLPQEAGRRKISLETSRPRRARRMALPFRSSSKRRRGISSPEEWRCRRESYRPASPRQDLRSRLRACRPTSRGSRRESALRGRAANLSSSRSTNVRSTAASRRRSPASFPDRKAASRRADSPRSLGPRRASPPSCSSSNQSSRPPPNGSRRRGAYTGRDRRASPPACRRAAGPPRSRSRTRSSPPRRTRGAVAPIGTIVAKRVVGKWAGARRTSIPQIGREWVPHGRFAFPAVRVRTETTNKPSLLARPALASSPSVPTATPSFQHFRGRRRRDRSPRLREQETDVVDGPK